MSKISINCSDRSKTYLKDKNEKGIQRFTYDRYIFNKNYKAKKKYLDEQFSRELKFQKNLLKSKGDENEDYVLKEFDETVRYADINELKETWLDKEKA